MAKVKNLKPKEQRPAANEKPRPRLKYKAKEHAKTNTWLPEQYVTLSTRQPPKAASTARPGVVAKTARLAMNAQKARAGTNVAGSGSEIASKRLPEGWRTEVRHQYINQPQKITKFYFKSFPGERTEKKARSALEAQRIEEEMKKLAQGPKKHV